MRRPKSPSLSLFWRFPVGGVNFIVTRGGRGGKVEEEGKKGEGRRENWGGREGFVAYCTGSQSWLSVVCLVTGWLSGYCCLRITLLKSLIAGWRSLVKTRQAGTDCHCSHWRPHWRMAARSVSASTARCSPCVRSLSHSVVTCNGVQCPLAGETETQWQECHRTLLQITNRVKLVIVFLFSFSYQRNKARQQKTAALHDAACCMSSTTYIHHPAAWN